MSLLDDILATKREEVATRRVAAPPSVLRERPLWAEPRRGFGAALAAATIDQGRVSALLERLADFTTGHAERTP